MFEINFNLPKVQGTYRFNADLSKTNWFRVGGKAQILFLPKDPEDLIFFLKNKPKDLAINILGVGSNIIIKDGGVEGVVIKLGGNFAKINLVQGEEKFNLQSKDFSQNFEPKAQDFQSKTTETQNEGSVSNNLEYQFIKIGAGCLCFNVALYSKINGFSGLEFLSGVPGSVGGAIAMNAGCYGSEIADKLILATAIDFNGNLIELKNQDFGFKYRGNSLLKNLIFVEGVFAINQSTVEAVGKKIAELGQKREATQPIRAKTGGSTFKNPDEKAGGKKAWQLIDEAGCRGMKVGDAQISEKHCNFMINNGNATAQDLINLSNLVIEKVKAKSGITLEMEIKIIGRD